MALFVSNCLKREKQCTLFVFISSNKKEKVTALTEQHHHIFRDLPRMFKCMVADISVPTMRTTNQAGEVHG